MSLARHTAYNLAGWLSPVVVSIATVPIYLHLVGLERYGLLAICWTILGFLGFLGLGMGPAVAQRLAKEHQSSAERRSQIYWHAAAINLAMAVVGGAIIALLGQYYFAMVETTDAQLRLEVNQSLPWLAAAFILSMSNNVSNGALQGRQWFGVLNATTVGAGVAISIVPLAAVMIFGVHLRTMVVATTCVYFGVFLLQFAIARRAVPLRGRPDWSVALCRDLFSYGGWMTVISLLLPITMLSDRLLIGARLGSAAVPLYTIPYNLVSRVIALPASLSSASLPKLAGAGAEAERDIRVSGLLLLLACLTPVCVAGNLIMGPFLTLWVGSQIASSATIVGCVLVFGFWMHGIGHVPATVLFGRDRPDLIAKLYLAYLVPYLTLLLVLMDMFGIVGAAIAWAIRASMDLILFAWTGLSKRHAVMVGGSAALVATSTITASVLDWNQPKYWMIGLLILIFAAASSWYVTPNQVRARIGAFLPALRLKDT